MSWLDHPLHCGCNECMSADPAYAGARGAARGLIERLSRGGVAFRLAGDAVRFFPAKAVTGEDLEELRRLKPAIVEVLQADDAHKLRGEGNVRDELEVFDMARKFFGKRERDAA